MATIYDVAKRAGVSPATVSRVFNGHGASPEKAEAVREAARALDFTPNRVARSLRRRAGEVIALVIPDIENPYFTELARGVEDIAQEAGYSVVLCNSDGESEKEATYLKIAGAERMAGVILAAADESSASAGRAPLECPVVAVDRHAGDDIDSVVMDNVRAGRAATESLLEAGYRRVACITGPQQVETARGRAEGWRQAVQGRGGSDELLEFSTFRVEGGREAIARMLDAPEPPDAVVAGNNLIGVGVLQQLGERGIAPTDFGVAVVGALPFTTLPPDAVTIMRLPARHMGVLAAQTLLERIAGDDQPPRTIVLRGELHPAVR